MKPRISAEWLDHMIYDAERRMRAYPHPSPSLVDHLHALLDLRDLRKEVSDARKAQPSG